jgi:hypothetical protein
MIIDQLRKATTAANNNKVVLKHKNDTIEEFWFAIFWQIDSQNHDII